MLRIAASEFSLTANQTSEAPSFAAGLDPHDFVHRHVDLLLVGLAAPQTKKVPAASTRKKKA